MARLGTSLLVAFTLFLSADTIHSALAADDCSHLKGFWLDLISTDEGYLVPVSVAGTPRLFLLATSSGYAKLDEKVVEELKLPTKAAPEGFSVVASKVRLTRIATSPTIQLGPVTRRDAEFLISPHNDRWGPRADGEAGINIFGGFDIELDLAHNKVGLFLPRDCKFVPYWKYDVFGNSSFVIEPTGIMLLPMTLDGKRIEASISTAHEKSYMGLTVARMLLGIEEKSSSYTPADKTPWGKDTFRYPFKTLTGGDNVTINNPEIYVNVDEGVVCGGIAGRRIAELNDYSHYCYSGGDVELGRKELRQLRMFFVFKEKRVYFTLAEPRS